MNERPASFVVRRDTGFSSMQLGMILFLSADAMFLGALVSALALIRFSLPDASSLPGLSPTTGVLGVSFLLLTGGLIVSASRVWDRLSRAAKVVLPSIAMLSAAGFVALRTAEMSWLSRAGWTPSSDIRAALFFTLMGVLGVQVVAGIVVSVRSFVAMLRFPSEADAARVRVLSWWWMFVAIMGIILSAGTYAF